ncbi:MAG: hypothetical protein [Bacteriophage sp.]|nr:MAG: hypothetical protein [Bacteriophage sp.]
MSNELHRSGEANAWKDASPVTSNFFEGFLQTGSNSFDPYVSGYAFIFWLKVPFWVEQNYPQFSAFSQKNFKSFQGHNNIELETEGAKMGFTQNETHYTKGIGAKPAEFTLKYQEHSGAAMTPAYNSWVSGIRDPRTGIATYPKNYNVQYHSKFHTGTLLYVVTRPDADNVSMNNIEFASMWTHVQPKRINIEHYNYDQGTHDMFDLDQPFSGYFNMGPEIEKLAKAKMNSESLYGFRSEGDYNPLTNADNGAI